MRTVTLISDTLTPCGVESFQRELTARLNARAPDRHATCAIVGQPGETHVLARVLTDADALIVGLPMVAWKQRLVAPARAMAVARRLGKAVLLVLHEWADLDWKRRALYRLYLPLATHILFSSPHVRAQFEMDPTTRLATARRGLVPIPPNLARPTAPPAPYGAAALAAARATGALIVGHFGAIYPRKQSADVLDLLAELKRRGRRAHGLFIGSFIGGSVDVRADFEARIARLGLQNDTTVTGYLGPAADVFAALDAADVFVYRFAEGLTSRRGSVLTCLQTAHPVLVNAPPHTGEFDHHPTFRTALASGRLTLLPTTASMADYADRIITGLAVDTANRPLTYADAWADAAAAVEAMLADRHAAPALSQRAA
jgi:glycosyltransferase involved in cell wall biosynthesis